MATTSAMSSKGKTINYDFSQAVSAAKKAAELKRQQDKQEQIDDENRVFSRAKEGFNIKTDAQSRLQRERSEQALSSQREGVEGQSRLQRERSDQSSKLQAQAAAEAAARKAGDRAAAIASMKRFARTR